ncbi:MAG: dihydroorotate dehydrogenase-like protein [Candidatus Cloacimonetes bacterium]|nr:dihydroorotate dehydrogenase-like protein [Candidatus Cloacimonadota bacterium]
MVNTRITYMGLELKSPVIAGSCGLNREIETVKKLEEAGAGAVILPSLFEEQIENEIRELDEQSAMNSYPEAHEMMEYFQRRHVLDNYLQLIKDMKAAVSIPVIASINCYRYGSWTDYAREIAAAGADALEVNIFYLPSDPKVLDEAIRKEYLMIASQIARETTIPVSIKVSTYFENVARSLRDLSFTGIKGLVLFNRFYSPDIDIEKLEMVSGDIFSHHSEFHNSLRWTGIMYGKTDCDLCTSTGVHDGIGVVKMLLAGAQAVQMVSSLYTEGIGAVQAANEFLQLWMSSHNYQTIDEFRGKLSQENIKDPAFYERAQFLKYFSKYKH